MYISETNSVDDGTWVTQVVGTGLTGSQALLLGSNILSPGGVGTINFYKVGVLNSALTGAGNFVKTGPGTLMMAGRNTNTGDTVVNQGTVVLGGIESGGRYIFQNILSDQSAVVLGTSARVEMPLNASNLLPFERVGSVSGGGGSAAFSLVSAFSSSEKSVGALAFGGDNSDRTFVGVIEGQDTAARVFVMKEGAGTFVYRSNNLGYDGTTRVDGGTWVIPAPTAFNSFSSGLNGSAAQSRLELSNRAGVVFRTEITQPMPFLVGGVGVTKTFRTGTLGALAGNYINQSGGELQVGSGAAFVVNGTGGETWFSGAITGAGGFSKSGTVAMVLAGANTYSGDTVVAGGDLHLGYLSAGAGVGDLRPGGQSGSFSASTLLNLSGGGSVHLNGLNTSVRTLSSTNSSAVVTLGNGTLTLEDVSGEAFKGAIRAGGGFSATGNGLVNIGQVVLKTGSWTIKGDQAIDGPSVAVQSGGILNINSSTNNALKDSTRVFLSAGGSMVVGGDSGNSSETIGSLHGTGTVDLGTGRSLVLTQAGGSSHGVFGGQITGAGSSLVLDGIGRLDLQGTNSYTGETVVKGAATLSFSVGAGTSSARLSDSSVLRMGQGNILLRDGRDTSGSTISDPISPTLETVAGLVLDRGANTILQEPGSLGAINVGAITVNQGAALNVGKNAVLTTTSNLETHPGGALITPYLGGWATFDGRSWAKVSQLDGGEMAISGLEESDYVSGWFPGSHTLLTGSMSVTPGGSNTSITTETLAIGAITGVTADLVINRTGVINSGGILVTPELGGAEFNILPGNNSPTLKPGGNQFIVHQYNAQGVAKIAVPMEDGSSATSLTKTGPGTLVLTARNTFSGPVTIGGGTLQLGDGASTEVEFLGFSTGDLINHGMLSGSASPDKTIGVGNNIVGSGGVRQISEGGLILSGAQSTYTGRTSVVKGLLQVTSAAALGSTDNLTAVEQGATLSVLANIAEPIALDGGTINTAADLGGTLIVAGDNSSINVTSGQVSLNAPVLAPLNHVPTFSVSGDVLNLTQPMAVRSVVFAGGNVNVQAGATLGAGPIVNDGALTFVTGNTHRAITQQISGTGGLTFNGGEWFIGENNTYTGRTEIGFAPEPISLATPSTVRTVVHVGLDGFSGSLGTGDIEVTSPTDNNSAIRFHRMDTLTVGNQISLNANTNGSTTGRNVDFVKEGVGNLIFTGTLKAGRTDQAPATQRALVTVNGGGRMIFQGGGASHHNFDNSNSALIAINNNGHIEFRSDDPSHTDTLFGALGGGGTWVFNGGTITLANQGLNSGGWSGNAFVHRGVLETAIDDQLGSDLDTIVTNGGTLRVGGVDTSGNFFSQKGGILEINSSRLTFDDGDEKTVNGRIIGGGDLNIQGGTMNLYATDNSFTGTLMVTNGTARVRTLANSGVQSSAGSGSDIQLGWHDASSPPVSLGTGTLEYIGLGSTTNRNIILGAPSAEALDVGRTFFTVSSNGVGALVLNSNVVTTSVSGVNVVGRKAFVLAGENRGDNIFSGNITPTSFAASNEIDLVKNGNGTWHLTGGNRSAFSGDLDINGGTLLVDSLAELGNLSAAREFNLGAGMLQVQNSSAVTETLGSNIWIGSAATGGISNTGNSTVVINSPIFSGTFTDTSLFSVGSHNLVLDGTNSTANTINGVIGAAFNNMGITKNGSGRWVIANSTNLLTGGTTINAGTLDITGGNALADGGTVNLTNAAVNGFATGNSRLNIGQSETIGALQGAIGTTVSLAAGQTLSLVGGSATFQGVIQEDGPGAGLTVTSNTNDAARVATFSNINTYSGPVSILGGTLSDRSAANRIDVYYLANGGSGSGIGSSSNAASNLTINTNGKGGGLRYIGFNTVNTDRLFTLGVGNGAGIGESAASIWADGQISGNKVPVLNFTNTGALAYTGLGSRKLTFRGSNRGDGVNLNTFSPAIADGPGGTTSIGKTDDSVWLINGNNTFTGSVAVERGTISFAGSGLGTGTGTVTVTQVSNDIRSFFDLKGGVVSNRNLALVGGANNTGNGWGASAGVNVWNGSVANDGGNGIWGVLGASTVLTINGPVTGGLNISKVGNGKLELAGANTASGAINMMGGTLKLNYATQNNSKLADFAGLTLGGTGATAVQGGGNRGGTSTVFQRGSVIEISGGNHTEVVSGTTLNAGASSITRSIGDTGNSKLNLAGITSNAGGTLDVVLPDFLVTNATTTAGSTTVTCDSTGLIAPGMIISGPNIPMGATVASITGAQTFVLSRPAIGAGSGQTFRGLASSTVTLTRVSTTNGNSTITCASTAGLSPGMIVLGASIPAGSNVSSVDSATTFKVTTAPTQTSVNMTVNGVSFPANYVSGSKVVTCASTAGISVGHAATGTNVPTSTTVAAVTGPTTFVLSNAVTATVAVPLVLFTVPGGATLANGSTNGTNTITVTSTAGLVPGMIVSGTNIPPGAKVASVNSNGTEFTIDVPTTGTGSGISIAAATQSVALTNTLNNTTVTGVLGGYVTVNKTFWAQSGTTGTGLAIVPATNYLSSLQNSTLPGLWSNQPAFVNSNLDIAASMNASGTVGLVTFNTPTNVDVTVQGKANVSTGGVLITPNVGANTISFNVASTNTYNLTNCVTIAANAKVVCDSTAGLVAEMAVTGPNIPANATIAAVNDATSFNLKSGTGVTAGTGLSLTASYLTSLTNCSFTTASRNVTCDSTVGLLTSSQISGPGFPSGASVESITNATTFVVNVAPSSASTPGTTLAVKPSITGGSNGGAAQLAIHQHNTAAPVIFNTPIVNSGATAMALTKSGLGELVLMGNNTQTGGTFINEGTVRVGQGGTAEATLGGNAAAQVNGTLILDASGAETRLASNGSFRGDGTVTLAATNTRAWVVGGSSGSFNGTINVLGGKLVMAPSLDNDDVGFGSSNSTMIVGPLGTIEFRGNTRTDEQYGMANNLTLYGTVRADFQNVATGVVPRIQSAITIPTMVPAELAPGGVSVANNPVFDIVTGAQLNLNNLIYSSIGITKTGQGRLVLNAQQTSDALLGDTGRSASYTLSGQIRVNQGELWLSGGNRAGGAPGVGNEIVVASGATLDLRGQSMNFADDASPLRKIIQIQGTGFSQPFGTGTISTGALRNTTGTATISHLELLGDATVGSGGVANNGRIDLQPYDINPNTGASVGALVNFQPATLKSVGGNYNLTKIGTVDFVIHDALVTGLNQFKVAEGELRWEINNAPNAGNGNITAAGIQNLLIAYSNQSPLDATLGTTSGGPLVQGPVVGSRVEFYRNYNQHHTMPISMDGVTAAANKGTNYIEANSDGGSGSSVPASRVYLDGGISVSGPATSNLFNIDGGLGNNVQAIQGNQTQDVLLKMIVGAPITGSGGISKIGFRELRLTANNTYTGDTVIARAGNMVLPGRSDTVSLNGVDYTTLGAAESWGEFGLTLNGGGRLSGTANVIMERSGMLTLDNSTRLDASSAVVTTNHSDRVNNAANVIMRQGWLRLIGADSGNTSEVIATVGGAKLQAQSGTNLIDLWPKEGSNQTLTLTIGEISRSPGAVLRFRNLDATSGFSSTTVGSRENVQVALTSLGSLPEVGSGATATSRKIIPGLLGGSAPNGIYEDTRLTSDLYSQGRNLQNATGSHFMTWDGGFLRPLDDSEYATTSNGVVSSALNGQNVNLTDFNHFVRESVSLNSLRFGPTMDSNASGSALHDGSQITSYTDNWQPTIYIDSSAVLSVTSGMISSAAFAVAGTGVNETTYIRGGAVDFGSREGIINNQNYWLRLMDGTYLTNNFELQTAIRGSGGLTKVGNASVVLDGLNTYTGTTTINDGILFARNGRSALGANGRAGGINTGNNIVVQGSGDFRLTNGVMIGAPGAPKDLLVKMLSGENQILRSENGNNALYGNITLDNVDANGHTSQLGRPRMSVNTNQSLVINGDIAGGDTALTDDIYYTDSRMLSLNGAGYIWLRGQVGDKFDSNGLPVPVSGVVTSLPSSATVTNENQVFRLQITANDDLNVAFDKQYNAAGRLSMDRGVMLVNYDPATLGGGETGFWTQAALSRLTGDPALGGSSSTITSNSTNSNGLTSQHGFLLANNLGDGGGSAAVFLTKANQVFNMPEWRVSSNHGGAAWIGGTNETGTVTFGGLSGVYTSGLGTLSLEKTARFYAMSGGNVVINHRLNGGNFIKVGRGKVTLQNSVVKTGSDTQSFELSGGELVLDMNGQFTTSGTTNSPVSLVANAGTFTSTGGILRVQGVSKDWGGLLGGADPASGNNVTVSISTDNNAGGRLVRFNSGLTQIIADARDGKNVTLSMGSTVTQNNGVGSVQRSLGATASFVAYNSTGPVSYTQQATMATGSTSAQTTTINGGTVVNGSVSVTDGTFTWSQASGSSSSLWTVSYNASTQVVSVTYNPALGTARTLTITCQLQGTSRINLNISADNTAALANGIIPWAVTGTGPNLAHEFALIDATDGNRVKGFGRSPDEFKNDVTLWTRGEDVSEDTADSRTGGAGFYGTLDKGGTVNTLRFDAAADSAINVASGQSLFVANSGLLVTTNTGFANKTINGGRLVASLIMSGRVTKDQNVVTGLDSTSELYIGMPVSGTGIPAGTFVQEIVSPTSVKLTALATITTVRPTQGIQFGTAELIVHQYGQGDLTINSGMGNGTTSLPSGTTTVGSNIVTVASTVGITPGVILIGNNIRAGATVVSVTSATTFTMSLPAFAGGNTGSILLVPPRTMPATVAGATASSGSAVVTVATTEPVVEGMVVTGPGIPNGTLVLTKDSATQITLTNKVTSALNNDVLYVTMPNDVPSPAVVFTGGVTRLDSTLASVSNTGPMFEGMGIVGTNIPANTVVRTLSSSADPNNVTDFQLSQLATANGSGLTFTAIKGSVVLTNASVTANTNVVTAASTTGLFSGMPVLLPHVPAGAVVQNVTSATSFTISIPVPAVISGATTGLTGFAQYPGSMPSLLTGGQTFSTAGNERKLVVSTTAGITVGLPIIGPNLQSGTVVEQVFNATTLIVSKNVTGAGTGNYLIGTKSYLPLTLLNAIITNGSNVIHVASTAGLGEGLVVIAPGIPGGATVVEVNSANAFIVSSNANASSSGNAITIVSPMSLVVSGPTTTTGGTVNTGAVVLTNTDNNYGGKTYINGGILSIDDEAVLGPEPANEIADQITINGGTLRWTGPNGLLSQTRGITLAGSGGVIDVVNPSTNLMIQKGITTQELYRGDLVKTGSGTLTFEGDNGNMGSFQGLIDVKQGTLRVAGDNPNAGAGTSSIFGSNISWADGTVMRSGTNLMLQMGNANGGGDWNFEEFITFEGNNFVTVGTLGAAVRPMNWNGPIAMNGTTTFEIVPGQTFRFNTGGGFIQGSGDIVKDGQGTMEFRENIPDWKGGLSILQGRTLVVNQGDALGSGNRVAFSPTTQIPVPAAGTGSFIDGNVFTNTKIITLGSNQSQGVAELLIQSDLGTAGSVWEVNHPINVVYGPAQTKRLGAAFLQNVNGSIQRFNGDITLNDNLILYYEDNNNNTPAGGKFVNVEYNGRFFDGAVTSGNLVIDTNEGANGGSRVDSTNGRMFVTHSLNADNSGWTGDLVISNNASYGPDQTSIARLGHGNALTDKNDVTMNYNSILQAGGNSVTIGSLQTKGGTGAFLGNVGTVSANVNASTEIIENAALTPGTLRIAQATPSNVEVKWDAFFRDGTPASTVTAPGSSIGGGSLSIIKAGNGWASLTLQNQYTGTTVVEQGTLQVGVNGIGDTGAVRNSNVAGLTLNVGATLAGSGAVQGAAVLNGLIKPGDVGGAAMGTLSITGNVVFGAESETIFQLSRPSFTMPELLNATAAVVADPVYQSQRDNLLLYDTTKYVNELNTPILSSQHDSLTIGGTVQVTPGAKFTVLLNGYTPTAGDVFRLLNLDSNNTLDATGASGPLAISTGNALQSVSSGVEDLILPSLGDAFLWDTSMFTSHGLLLVVGSGPVPDTLTLTTWPLNRLVPLNSPWTMNVAAAGQQPINYVWKKNGTPIAGAVSSSYTIPSVNASTVGKYSASATNSSGSVERPPAVIAAVDTSTTSTVLLKANGTTTLKVVTAIPVGVLPGYFGYQWMRNGVPINDTDTSVSSATIKPYAGATTANLTIKSFAAEFEGVYTCRVTMSKSIPNTSNPSTTPSLVTGANTVLLAAIPEIGAVALPSGKVGSTYGPPSGYQVPYTSTPANKKPTSWSATGLPTGLTINPLTGVISGTPTQSTTSTIKFENIRITASNAAGTVTAGPFAIVVAPLSTNVVGTFVALADRTGTGTTGTLGLGARVDVTVSANAKWTGKLIIGAVSYPISGSLNSSGLNPTATKTITRSAEKPAKSNLNLFLEFDASNGGLVSGTITDVGASPTTALLNGWRAAFSATTPAKTRAGIHNFKASIPALLQGDEANYPQGDSYATANVSTAGSVAVAGKAADGSAVTTTAPLGASGQFLVYQFLYTAAKPGSFVGTAVIDEVPNVHAVTGTLTWSRTGGQLATTPYPNGWSAPISLSVMGGLYVPPVTPYVVMAADPSAATNAKITFFDSTGIDTSESVQAAVANLAAFKLKSPAVYTAPVSNPASVTMSIKAATGTMTGTFKLNDAGKIRSVSYFALIVPDTTTASTIDQVGAGYFTLAGQLAATGIRSGRVNMVADPAPAPAYAPVLLAPTFPTVAVSAAFTYAFPYDTDPAKAPTVWSATGLPKGLTINTSTGVISGTPVATSTGPVTYNAIYVTAKGRGGVTVLGPFTMVVAPIHSNAIGTFVALAERSGGTATGKGATTGTLGIGARVDITTTYTGTYTGKLVVGATTYALTGTLDNSGANPRVVKVVTRAAPLTPLTITFDILTSGSRLVTGTITDTAATTANLNGWGLVWNTNKVGGNPATARAGLYNTMLSIPALLEGDTANPNVPQGDGYMSAKASLAGSVVVAGKTAEGSAIASTAPMGPNGEFLVYQFLHTATNPGSISGTPVISSVNHGVSGSLAWAKAQQDTGNLYKAGWPTAALNLEVSGGLYVVPVKPNNILGARSADSPVGVTVNFNDYINATVTFFGDTGLPASYSATNPNHDLNNDGATKQQGVRILSPATLGTTTTRENPGALTMTFTTATGLFTGSITLKDGTTTRVVPYYGMIIPDAATATANDAIGAGYFVLPPLSPSTASKSGRVSLLPIF